MKIRLAILAACAGTLFFAAAAHAQKKAGVPISGTDVGLEGDNGISRAKGTKTKSDVRGKRTGDPLSGTPVGLEGDQRKKANAGNNKGGPAGRDGAWYVGGEFGARKKNNAQPGGSSAGQRNGIFYIPGTDTCRNGRKSC